MNDDDTKNIYNQLAYILNYQPQIKEQNVYVGAHEDAKEPNGEDADTTDKANLSDARKAILRRLIDWVDNGDWVKDIKKEDIKQMLRNVLGVGKIELTEEERRMSATLWDLMEKRRGNDKVKITWQNLVGYFSDLGFFNKNGSPSLNKDFFKTDEVYTNIDKGRPSRDKDGDNMPPLFRQVLPLLDKYAPRLNSGQK